jgi:hypothetical protein
MASGVLNTFCEAGNAFGVALFGEPIVGGTVAGIQHAIILSGLPLLFASGISGGSRASSRTCRYDNTPCAHNNHSERLIDLLTAVCRRDHSVDLA